MKEYKRKIYQLNSELHKVTGIQRVLMDVHEALKPIGAKIVGTIPFDQVSPDLKILEEDYERMRSYRMFKHATVIIHERRYLPIFWFMNNILNLDIQVIYIHHNQLYGQKLLSRFPNKVIAISDAGIKNLTEYFSVPNHNITKIHNCVRQPQDLQPASKSFNPQHITILYPARINSVKQQIEIVQHLQNKLDSRITILFAGTGPDYESLQTICADSKQFIPLGYRNDVLSLMQKADFIMLFSKHEGLPISLIEAAMTGTPIICNSVGGNTEIAMDRKNAFIVNDWYSLQKCLNSLPDMKPAEYYSMSSAGKEKYMADFTFERFRNDYLNLVMK